MIFGVLVSQSKVHTINGWGVIPSRLSMALWHIYSAIFAPQITGIGQLLLKLLLTVGWSPLLRQCIGSRSPWHPNPARAPRSLRPALRLHLGFSSLGYRRKVFTLFRRSARVINGIVDRHRRWAVLHQRVLRRFSGVSYSSPKRFVGWFLRPKRCHTRFS